MDDINSLYFSEEWAMRSHTLSKFSERIQTKSPAVLERYARRLEPKSLLDRICFAYDPVRQDRLVAAYEIAKQKRETYL